jgi:hypothetical protein
MADESPIVAVLSRQGELLVELVRATDEQIATIREVKGWHAVISDRLEAIERHQAAEAAAKVEIAALQKAAEAREEAAAGERWRVAREAGAALWTSLSGNIVIKGAATLAISLLLVGGAVFTLEAAGLDVDRLIRLVPGVETLMGPERPERAPVPAPSPVPVEVPLGAP